MPLLIIQILYECVLLMTARINDVSQLSDVTAPTGTDAEIFKVDR